MNVTDKETKYSQHQIKFEDSLQEDSAEHESYVGAATVFVVFVAFFESKGVDFNGEMKRFCITSY